MLDLIQAEALLRELVASVEEACGPDVWDRDDWHGGGKVSHASFVPDGRAGVR